MAEWAGLSLLTVLVLFKPDGGRYAWADCRDCAT
jgi:hypothetical protein